MYTKILSKVLSEIDIEDGVQNTCVADIIPDGNPNHQDKTNAPYKLEMKDQEPPELVLSHIDPPDKSTDVAVNSVVELVFILLTIFQYCVLRWSPERQVSQS